MAGEQFGLPDPLAYIFGGTSGLSYPELKRRREIAAILAARGRKAPQNIGEGLTYLGESIANRFENQRLSEAEKAQRATDEAGLAPPPAVTATVALPAPPAPAGVVTPPNNQAGPIQAPPTGDPNTLFNPARAQDQPYTPAVPPVPAVTPAPRAGLDDDPVWARRSQAIAGIESGGAKDPYRLMGARTRTGDRAIGKYQIMGANVPSWTEAALGQRMTPEEFRNDPAAQEATARHRFTQYADKYGDEGAARAWYAGEGGMKNLGATDVHGRLTVGGYGQDFMRRMGGPGAVAGAPPGSRESIAAIVTQAPQGPPTPQEIASQGIQQEVLGGGGGGGERFPPTAAVGRAGVASDASPVGAVPVGAATQNAIGDTLQARRNAITGTLQQQRPPAGPVLAQRSVPMTASDQPQNWIGQTLPPIVRGGPPSTEAIPPPNTMEYPDPGPRPGAPLPTEQMRRDWAVMHQPYKYSDEARDLAAKRFQRAQQMQQEEYRNAREGWEQRDRARTEWNLKGPQRRAEDLKTRLEIQAKQAELAGQPDVARKLRADADKAEREAAKPEMVGAKGTQFQRPAGASPDTPFTVPPGLPQPTEDALTADQAKGVEFVLRTAGDLAKLETMDNGKILATPTEALRDVPGVGNLLVSPQYQQARNAANNWGAGFIQRVSGAAVSPSEADRNLPAFLPRPGDSDEELAAKSQRRRTYTEAVSRTSGREGLKVIEQEVKKLNEDYSFAAEGKKPPVRVNSPREAESLNPGQRIILPDGRPGVVPRKGQ